MIRVCRSGDIEVLVSWKKPWVRQALLIEETSFARAAGFVLWNAKTNVSAVF